MTSSKTELWCHLISLGGGVSNLLLYFYCCLIVDKKSLVQKWNLLVWRLLNIWNKSHSHGNLSASAQRLVWALVLHSQWARVVCSATAPSSRASESSVPDSSFFHREQNPCPGRAAPDPGSCVAFSDEHLGFLPKSMFRAHSAVSVSPAAAGHMEGVHHLWLNSAFGWLLFWVPGAGDQCSQHFPLTSIPVPALNHVGAVSHFLAPLEGVVSRKQRPGGLWPTGVIPSLASCAVQIRVLACYFHFKISSS